MATQSIDTIRHSTAHVMAHAIKLLFPTENVQLGVGPTLDYGFYYDVLMTTRLSEEHLGLIEEKMKEIIAKGLTVTRHEISRADAVDLFSKEKEHLKVELIHELPENETITYYKHGDEFFDLCRGPHVENTKELPRYFKLLHTAGAYWKGDQSKTQLQRIYAACFLSKEALKDHLTFLEEAKKRDHRKLGKELELFIFDPVAPASPFFMPKGAIIYNGLVEFMRQIYKKFGYQEVITPQVLDVELWHTSGHYAHYKENMYFTKVDERDFALKPMNCPCHMLMFSHHQYSYRELPLRFADFGRLHRYERSGVVAGLTRVRSFCQDDAHIFVSLEGIASEIKDLLQMFFVTYDHFGFKSIQIQLSTRPEQRMGSEETWDLAEGALTNALLESKYPYTINEGDGAFYGPKIDIQIADALGRYHQLGTIQLDFQLPERFDLHYTNMQGERVRPVVIHRALLGSLERFFGVYLEHVAGAFPFWLAPEQLVIIPVKNDLHEEHAQGLKNYYAGLGMRVRVDNRNESLGLKTRQAQTSKIPFMAVIGDKELQDGTITLRKYGEQKQNTYSLEQATQIFLELEQEKIPEKLR